MTMKKGFTLIELLVVIGMIAILTGAVSSSVSQARKRSQISRAETETREMTNAILAYENYDKNHSLSKYVTSESGTDADKRSLGFILGEGTDAAGNRMPVLFNASTTGSRGEILDPWGKPYKFMILKAGEAVKSSGDKVGTGLETFLYVPNRYWKPAD